MTNLLLVAHCQNCDGIIRLAIKSDIAAIAKLDEQLAEFRFLIFGKPPNLRLGGKIFNTYAN